jgi:N6-L-threonylcarbamoyladenine synthase
MKDTRHLTLGIESSCDETSAAVVADGRTVLSNVIASQVPTHKIFGGVVPEIASRHHLENVNPVIAMALGEAGVTLDDVDLIGVTNGPGLVGALLIGVAAAKTIAFAKDIPLVGVHHIRGHVAANFIADPALEPPFLAFVVSGGHTHIMEIRDYNDAVILGRTRDDAAGEAFDKVARVLGLGYPGGPLIDRAARGGDPHAIEFKRVLLEKDSLDFSFSGTKTGVLNYMNREKALGHTVSVPDVAASFQQSVVDTIVTKADHALEKTGYRTLALAGGVASNSLLRESLAALCEKRGVRFICPPPVLCTDNAAMIACAAYYKAGAPKTPRGGTNFDDLRLDADPNLPL